MITAVKCLERLQLLAFSRGGVSRAWPVKWLLMGLWVWTCASAATVPAKEFPQNVGPIELADVRWQVLPEAIQAVSVGPDDRVWYQLEYASSAARIPLSKRRIDDPAWHKLESLAEKRDRLLVRRIIAEQFNKAAPQLFGARPVLFEPGGHGVLATCPLIPPEVWRWREGVWRRIDVTSDRVTDVPPSEKDGVWLLTRSHDLEFHAMRRDGTTFVGTNWPGQRAVLVGVYRPGKPDTRRTLPAMTFPLASDSNRVGIDSEGAVWANLEDRGLSRFSDGQWHAVPELSHAGKLSLFLPGDDGRVIGETGSGLFYRTPQSVTPGWWGS